MQLAEGVDRHRVQGPKIVKLPLNGEKIFCGKIHARNNGKTEYLVTGVYEEAPPHSHMQVDAMLSFATYAHLVGIAEEDMNSWMWDGSTPMCC